MAWISLKDENNRVQLTDGYSVGRARAPRGLCGDQSPEQDLANYLYQRAQRYSMRFARRYPKRPDVDVWVVGAPGWLQRPLPAPFDAISEGETDDRYRILITSERTQSPAYVHGWIDWLRRAGMQRKKQHTDMAHFRRGGTQVLEDVRRFANTNPSSPTAVLAQYDVPVVHAGALRD